MKKLLTIMLAVLLAVPAIAASAEDNVKNADIIIVGAGGGGLSAAIEAVNDGARDRAGRADQRDSVRHLHRQNHRGYRGAQRFRVLEFLLRAGQAV